MDYKYVAALDPRTAEQFAKDMREIGVSKRMSDAPKEVKMSSPELNELAQAIAGIIHASVNIGNMPLDEVLCVMVSVAADYARLNYGDDYLKDLSEVVLKRAEFPMPALATVGEDQCPQTTTDQ